MTRNTAGSLLSVLVGRCPTVPYFRVTTGKIDVRVIKKKVSQSTKRARSGRKRERALRPGLRIHLGRGGQSANSVKLYKISSWEPGKKHHSTCRAS